MKAVLFFVLLLGGGCSASLGTRSGDFDHSLLRTFSSTGIDDETCLRLKADHTYLEYAGALLTTDSEADRMAAGLKGRWEQKADHVFLFPPQGATREFQIAKKNGRTILKPLPGPGFPYQ